MPRAAPPVPTPGILDITVPGHWVLPDDQLWLGLVKPPLTPAPLILDDASRPEALALAQRLFAPNPAGQFAIAVGAAQKTAVVLFPEFAFGSADFPPLDTLIRQQTTPVIVLAGFGAVRGTTLRDMLQGGHMECGWTGGAAAVDAGKRYNAAWCWIHDPRPGVAAPHRCYVLLKNWPDQRIERIQIPNIEQGSTIVRLVTDDCDIYPSICSDVLGAEANGPHDRIAAAIRANVLQREKVLVPVMMLDANPSNAAWRTRLADLVAAAPQKVAIVTCNHVPVAPLPGEDDDQVRCLSGALVSVTQYSPDHRETPPAVRPFKFGAIAGYVLRSTAPGIISGDFTWREVGLVNRFIWLPNTRVSLDGATVVTDIDPAAQVETLRWAGRIARPAWLTADSAGDLFLKDGHARTGQALRDGGFGDAIWPGVLTGRGLDDKFPHPLDSAGGTPSLRAALDEAYVVLGSIMHGQEYRFKPTGHPGHFHRPAADGKAVRDVLIWSAPEKLYEQLMQRLQEAALDGRYSSAIVVIGRAVAGNTPPFGRVLPTPTTDISSGPRGNDEDIDQVAATPVFWMPVGDLQSLLFDPQWAQVPAAQRMAAIGLAVEALLNRPAA